MPKIKLLAGSLLLSAVLQAQSTAIPAAITTDPPTDKANPATMRGFQLPSHGALLNALVYVAAGAGPHPAVILLHGFPGNERNLDLAQSMRRAGFDVLYFNYRGAWGSPGDFSFTHAIEDTHAAIAYLRDPANAAKLRIDPAKIVLIGHSMGGFMAYQAGAADLAIKAIATISAADMNTGRLVSVPVQAQEIAVKRVAPSLAAEGLAPLAGQTPEGLARELVLHAKEWTFLNLVTGLATRPVLNITSDDGTPPANDALVEALRKAGDIQIKSLHFATDHSYSDKRIALQTAVLDWLASLKL
jgi:uncharacterized protein